jgi:1,4-alpha-glucan branching enzyme
MRKFLFLIISFSFSVITQAQLLTWTPGFIKENDSSASVVITVDATKGNKGLMDYNATTDVYVHTGVITNLSSGGTDWKYVKFNQDFNQPNAALNAAYIGNNKWQFTIHGSLRTFYGITNAAETINKIAILFRSGNGVKKQANSDGSDMYIPVYTSALAVRITDPFNEPRFIPLPEPISKNTGDNISISAIANKSSTIKILLNEILIQSTNNATAVTTNPTLNRAGTNTIIAEANDGTITVRDTLKFFVAAGINVASLPAGVRDGINYESDNTAVTLVLYAPGKNRISVIGDMLGSNWNEQPQYQMNKTPDGNYWWIRITGLTPSMEYSFQYLVNGSLKIADPYAKKILDPYNNNDAGIAPTTYPNLKAYPTGLTTGIVSILQTASVAYNWKTDNFTRPDKRGLVIYELLLRDFAANHDWKTLRDTLTYLKDLGINAIEIMPFNEFEGNNSWGYNPDFYFAPDKYYGPENTLKEFIDSCHSNGIAVIMDIALNHSFGLSPLVQLYFDAANNRPAADNPWFNPVARHAFNVGFDMNHESLATQYFTSRVVEHWLKEYKIDGFRFDLSKGFTQTKTCDDNGGNCNVNAWSDYDANRIAIWKRYYDTVQLKSANAYVILEHFAANAEEIELSDYGMLLWGNMNYSYAQASMGYPQDWNFEGGIFTKRNWSKPHLVTFMESHDEERIMYKNIQFGNSSGSYNIKELNTALKRSELTASFLLTIPGPKMIWQFGETGYDYSINHCTNGTVNNDCRLDAKPVRWDYLQNIERKRLHDVYRSLLKLRQHPLYKDAFMSNKIMQNLADTVKWLKVTTDTSNLLVVGNFGVNASTATVSFQSAGTWYDYLNGNTITTTGNAQAIFLQPGEYHVFLNRNIVNAVTTPVSNLPAQTNSLQIQVYPNPVLKTMYINVNMPQAGKAEINLMSMLGQNIATLYSGFLSKGNHTLSVNRNGISSNNYIVRVQTKNAASILKVLFQ